MEIFGALVVFFLAFIILSCCGFCCTKKRRGTVLSTPVVVTSTAHSLPGGYPIQAEGYQTSVHVVPYPTQNGVTMQVPMPMPQHMQNTHSGVQVPYVTPYPMPLPPDALNANPPSYDAVVGAGGGGHTNYATQFEKQAPYNPNFA